MIYFNIKRFFAPHLRKITIREMSSDVLFEDYGNKGVIILNRPKALNALTLNMIRSLYSKLKQWDANKSLILIKGSGDKAFCAGGDVVSITEAHTKGNTLSKDFFKEEYLLDSFISQLQAPYIAFITGITMGGGVGISVHGKYRVASNNSLFSMPETGIGLFPDVGGSYFLPKLKGNMGMYLGLTGQRLRGSDLLHCSIATHYCDQRRLSELEETLLKSDNDVEKTLQKFSYVDKDSFSLKNHLEKIDSCFSGNSVEDILLLLEEDGSEWAMKQISILNRMSPTSLKITFESLKRGMGKTLQQCLISEYRLTQRFCEDHDFYEGVRALLIDKDNSPRWSPNKLSEVTVDNIEKYFSPLPIQEELKL